MGLHKLLSRELQAATGNWGASDVIPPNSLAAASGSGAGLRIGTAVSCVRVLSTDVSILPFKAYDGLQGTHSPVRVQPPIVEEPFGPDLSPAAGFGQITVSMAVRGTAYLWDVDYDRDKFPTQVQIIHPDRVQVSTNSSGKREVRIGGQLQDASRLRIIPRQPMMPGSLLGMDPVTYYAAAMSAAAEVEEYTGSFWRHNAIPDLAIMVPGEGDRAAARKVLAAWEAAHSGLGNAHRPAVLFGDSKLEQLSITPEQGQFLETRAFLREDICGMYGVPPHRVMIISDKASQGGGKGLDSQDQGYVTHTLLGYTNPIEFEWSRMLPGGQSGFSRFDYRGLLRAAATERAAIQSQNRAASTRTVNEIRAEEDLPPLTDPRADDPFLPLNSATAGAPAGNNDPSSGGPA